MGSLYFLKNTLRKIPWAVTGTYILTNKFIYTKHKNK